MRILVIGSDSFIAQSLINKYTNTFEIVKVSRVASYDSIVVPDMFTIPTNLFNNIDIVLNFAAIVHQPNIKDESVYNKINYELAVLNAQKAKKAGVKLFVQMSTIAVYGNVNTININTLCNPQTPYGRSKLMVDEGLYAMQSITFKVAIVRPPMVYGGGKAPGNMMRLIQLANKRIPLPFASIDNKRDFIHVHNLVQYLALIAQKQLSGIYLVSDQQPVSTEFLLKTISKSLNKKPFLVKVPSWVLQLIKKLRPNEYNKLFGTLNIEPNLLPNSSFNICTVEQGIAEMVNWYKNL